MTPALIMDKLQKYLIGITRDMFLGPDRLTPNIYKVDLPSRATPDAMSNVPKTDIPAFNQEDIFQISKDERWPFIIITWSESEDNDEGYRPAQVAFTFGCEGEGAKGYMDVLHLMEHVRISFLRETWEGYPFSIERPLTMGFHEEQADPFWTGFMSTTWILPSIEEETWKYGY